MAGISVIEDKPKRESVVFDQADVDRWTSFQTKLPQWKDDRLTQFRDLGEFGPELIRLIRKLMYVHRVSGRELAKRIDSHRAYMQRILGTKTDMSLANPRVATLLKVMAALDTEFNAARIEAGRPKPKAVKIFGVRK